MLELLKNFLVCSFEVYMLHSLGKNILPLSLNKRINYSIASISIVIFVVVNSFNNTYINLICVPLIYCFYTLLCFKDSIFKRISIALCYYMLAIVPEFILASAISLSSNEHLKSEQFDILNEFLLTMLMKMVTFILVNIIGHLHRKHDYKNINNKMFFPILILPVSTVILLIGIFYADIHMAEGRKIILIIGVSLLLIANAYVFLLFEKIVENLEKIAKIEKLYIKSKAENIHLTQIEKVNEEHSMLLHDINKFLRAAAELVADGENTEAMTIFEQLDIRIKDSRNRMFCENKILSAILHERKEKAENSSVDLRIAISEDLYVEFLDDIDMISIVGNLLDNAIEAARKVYKQRYVEVALYMANEGNFLILEIKNNFADKPVMGKKGFITSKVDKGNHGIGIHTVEKIVQKYSGKLNIDITADEFITSIIFHVAQNGRE